METYRKSMSKESVTRSRTKIRILLVDDHVKLRAGIRRMLEASRDMLVVGEAGDGYEALELVERLEPDIVLLDVEMPRMNGMQVVREISYRHRNVKTLALSAYDDRQYILGMLDQGAMGYVIKDEVPDMLVHAIREIFRTDRRWMSQRVKHLIENE